MNLLKTKIQGLYILSADVFADQRGWFMESYSLKKFRELGIDINFIQDNYSYSKKRGVLRGLHFQTEPKAQSKLVRCIKGRILDIAVDLRKESLTYKKHCKVLLSQKNKKQLLIPKGFAHGFICLEDETEVYYKVDEYYFPEHEKSIFYNDPELNIDWEIENVILSNKDKNAPLLKDLELDKSI
ncbi:dTDP-4-dehydrorhamnose 3,5-epimerase [Halanaerobium hydrogeniformans]|uniref:dTDP-4-dehydrorhamnose 3,5-epimerase n=1 Tax=Halanaerobium hydrogeniformans TaxID=656519 RepID=E4RM05_HALHG|nr:dTDP-4-dehydrorhamnose 3,5-epimerase [Halanaerobium hydrogeniformans]ADQ14088.1 dTDP-4-dehydrorhamnose 3,5-epimerase [Halanaerobium hydrogeniformans]